MESLKEDNRSTKEELSKQIESLKEAQKSTKEELNSKIEEASRSTNQKIEEGQREKMCIRDRYYLAM